MPPCSQGKLCMGLSEPHSTLERAFSGAHLQSQGLTVAHSLQKGSGPGPLPGRTPGELRLMPGPDLHQPLLLVRIMESESFGWLLFSDSGYFQCVEM